MYNVLLGLPKAEIETRGAKQNVALENQRKDQVIRGLLKMKQQAHQEKMAAQADGPQ